MNPTIELMNARSSTRAYDPEPLSDEEKQAILHTTMRAPTAGNLMLYSIIEIDDQALKDRLAVTCDDQPFIAKAPWVLVFVADYQKWIDVFAVSGLDKLNGVAHRGAPGVGDLLDACCDALIAAQNAVIAAESLGIGSCYIGDILEQAEEHAELLGLPNHTLPIAMVCFGRPAKPRRPTPHYEKHVLHKDRYRRLNAEELREASAELAQLHAPRGFRPGTENIGQDVYARKYTAAFAHEMNRSVAVWLERWQTAETWIHGGEAMATESDPKTVVEALAEHEEAMSALYNAFAQAYPEVGDLWKTLCAEEYAHGKSLRSLSGRVGEPGLKTFVSAREIDLDDVRADTKRLTNLAQIAAEAGLPLQEAFRTAVHLEDSLIESQVFVVTDEDSPEVAEVLGTLREQTERHQKHLSESLASFSAG